MHRLSVILSLFSLTIASLNMIAMSRQVLGIPMGTSCTHLVNIFLYVYEKKADKGRIDDASSMANIFRYQDDYIVLNDKGLFDTIYQDIYPEELTLENCFTMQCYFFRYGDLLTSREI